MKKQKAPRGFYPRRIPKPGTNKFRQVYAPDEVTKSLIREYLGESPPLEFPRAIDCIAAHVESGNRYVFKIDLRDAFGSVRKRPLVALAIYTGMQYRAIENNAGPFFHGQDGEGGLIQGSPYSPYLFQLYCMYNLDPQLAEYCRVRGMVLTRYIDDITISAHEPIGKRKRRSIKNIIERAGFELNESKSKCVDTQLKPVSFLGASLYQGQVGVKPGYEKRIRGAVSALSKRGMLAYQRLILGLNRSER